MQSGCTRRACVVVLSYLRARVRMWLCGVGVMAAAPALIPLLGLAFLADEAFEWTFFALAVGFALAAGYAGYRVHRTRWVLAGFGMGILVLLAGRLGEFLQVYEGGAVLAVVGGAILVASHGASTVQTRACGEACAS